MSEPRPGRRWVGIDQYLDDQGLSWAHVERTRPPAPPGPGRDRAEDALGRAVDGDQGDDQAEAEVQR